MISHKTQARLRRILTMVPWVIARRECLVEEVVERFGYKDEADLARDMNLLSLCGLPGYGPEHLIEASIDGGLVEIHMAEYFSHPLALQPVEALVLLAAGLSVMDSPVAPEALERAVHKLAQVVLPDDPQALLARLPTAPGDVETLQQAVTDCQVVEITYFSVSQNEQTTRQVEPWAVTTAGDFWYLTAYCRSAKDPRTFRVDRMREVVIQDETFTPPAQSQDQEVQFVPSEDCHYAIIGLAPEARWVADYFPVEVLADTPEELVIRFSYTYARVPTRLLIKLGKSARLVEGEEVAQDLRHLREAFSAMYAQ